MVIILLSLQFADMDRLSILPNVWPCHVSLTMFTISQQQFTHYKQRENLVSMIIYTDALCHFNSKQNSKQIENQSPSVHLC